MRVIKKPKKKNMNQIQKITCVVCLDKKNPFKFCECCKSREVCRQCYNSFKLNTCPLCRSEYEEDGRELENTILKTQKITCAVCFEEKNTSTFCECCNTREICGDCFENLSQPITCPLCRSPNIYNEEAETFRAFRRLFAEERERPTLWDLLHNPDLFEEEDNDTESVGFYPESEDFGDYGSSEEDNDDERSTNSGDDMTPEELEEQNRQMIELLAESVGFYPESEDFGDYGSGEEDNDDDMTPEEFDPFEPVRDDPNLFPQPEPEDEDF